MAVVSSIPRLLLFLTVCFFLDFVGLTSASFPESGTAESDSVVEDVRYKRGKEKYEALRAEAKIPRYSKCWTDALKAVEKGCKRLTDETQHRMALAFANCFLQRSGRETYPCEPTDDIRECTATMKSEAYNTYTEFFTHTQNICFFLQSQIWQEETEKTVSRLSENSAIVAQQIEDSSSLQKEIMKKQNDSLQNQEQLLLKGNELKNALEDSAVDVHKMLKEFKEVTDEQKMSIMEVFDRIQSLQSLVLGEFTGFYSMVFYTTSLIVSYLLTSTPRTNGARFWLFFVMTLNVVFERLLVAYGASDYVSDDGLHVEGSATVYRRLQICRKCSCLVGVGLMLFKAAFYLDMNKVNNELLQTITEQNQQIKHLLQTSSTAHSSHSPIGSGDTGYSASFGISSKHLDVVDSPVEGYETGPDSDDSSDSGTTDRTYQANAYDSLSDCSSVSHLSSGRLSRSNTPALLEELRYLRQATPVKEHFEKFASLQDGGTPRRRGRPPGSRSSTPVTKGVQSIPCRYNLRTRHATPLPDHPTVAQESAEDFGRVVKHLARVSMRNSQKTKHTLERVRQSENARFFSSDED